MEAEELQQKKNMRIKNKNKNNNNNNNKDNDNNKIKKILNHIEHNYRNAEATDLLYQLKMFSILTFSSDQ